MDTALSLFQAPEPEKCYWILSFPFYGTFVYYGTDAEALTFYIKKSNSEGTGILRRADPNKPEDVRLVRDEIIAVRLDRQAGVPDLPFLPGKGWL